MRELCRELNDQAHKSIRDVKNEGVGIEVTERCKQIGCPAIIYLKRTADRVEIEGVAAVFYFRKFCSNPKEEDPS